MYLRCCQSFVWPSSVSVYCVFVQCVYLYFGAMHLLLDIWICIVYFSVLCVFGEEGVLYILVYCVFWSGCIVETRDEGCQNELIPAQTPSLPFTPIYLVMRMMLGVEVGNENTKN